MQQNHSEAYQPLRQWLESRGDAHTRLSFEQIADVLGSPLPSASRSHPGPWSSYGTQAVGRAIRDAGWRATEVDLLAQTVVLERRGGAVGDEVAKSLAEREVDDRIAGLLLKYADSAAVEICTDATAVLPLAASHDAYAAVYVAQTSISIALDSSRGATVHQRHGFRLELKNDATAYIHVAAKDLDPEPTGLVVLQLLREAFDRSFHGPRWNRGLPDRAIKREALCPHCYVEMPLNGKCQNCS